MENIKNKRLTLFLIEIMLLLQNRYIDEVFVEQINDFIHRYYKENKELFELLFDTDILEEFIKKNYQVLPHKILIRLINKYHSIEGYVKLIEEVGYETDQKLNILVIKFLEYYDEIINLELAEPTTIYQKILQ